MTPPDQPCRRHRLWVLAVAVLMSGCKAHFAQLASTCHHCDYRFSYCTPNPCNACVPVMELPCYGYTATFWGVWPEGCSYLPHESNELRIRPENLTTPEPGASQIPVPIQSGSSFPDSGRGSFDVPGG
jgi:hypothetical protein